MVDWALHYLSVYLLSQFIMQTVDWVKRQTKSTQAQGRSALLHLPSGKAARHTPRSKRHCVFSAAAKITFGFNSLVTPTGPSSLSQLPFVRVTMPVSTDQVERVSFVEEQAVCRG